MRYSRRMGAAAILRYLAIPLRTAPLLLIGTFSVLLVLAFKARITGIPLALIVLSWFSKYAFVVMDHLADGVAEPPVLSIEMVNPLSEQRPLILLLMGIGLYYGIEAASAWIGERGALVLLFAVGAILPAVVAVQGATGTVVQSVNPRRVLSLIGRLRGDYVLILGFIALVYFFSRFVLESAFGDHLPLVLRIALLMYAWLAMFSLIGGVLWERRLDIGLEDVHTPEHWDPGDAIGRSIASTRNGAAARTPTPGTPCWRWSARAAIRSASCAGCINGRRSGPTAGWPIGLHASCCRASSANAALAKRSTWCAKGCGRTRGFGRRAAPTW
jgi:hypothetical protein